MPHPDTNSETAVLSPMSEILGVSLDHRTPKTLSPRGKILPARIYSGGTLSCNSVLSLCCGRRLSTFQDTFGIILLSLSPCDALPRRHLYMLVRNSVALDV